MGGKWAEFPRRSVFVTLEIHVPIFYSDYIKKRKDSHANQLERRISPPSGEEGDNLPPIFWKMGQGRNSGETRKRELD